MSLTHLCSQINTNLQQHASPVTHAVPTAIGSALAEYRVDPTQQAHFHWLLSLAQPRPGSSRGKIGKTKVIGARKAINDFEMLVSSLQRLMQSGEIKPGDTKALQTKMKSMKTLFIDCIISKTDKNSECGYRFLLFLTI